MVLIFSVSCAMHDLGLHVLYYIINTSYQKLPFGSGDYPDKLLYHQTLN